jgi:hypothetical protein
MLSLRPIPYLEFSPEKYENFDGFLLLVQAIKPKDPRVRGRAYLAIHRKKPGVIDQIRAGRLKARRDGLLI